MIHEITTESKVSSRTVDDDFTCSNGSQSSSAREAVVERLAVLDHSADYIRILWDHWAHYCIFKIGVLLMYRLEGVKSVANFIAAYGESQ